MPRIKWKLCGSAEIDEWGDGRTSLLARLAEDPRNGLDEIDPGVYRGTTSLDHAAERPSWDCLACGRPWPCDPAREHLASRFGSVALAVHMWERLDEAVGDLRALPSSELFERFLKWTRARWETRRARCDIPDSIDLVSDLQSRVGEEECRGRRWT